jgi:cation diffusion facilitator family transporter
MSLRPPDANHPFGHGRIESLAGLFAGLSILAAAGFIAWSAFLEIRTPQHGPEWFTLPVLLFVVAVKWAVAIVIRRMGREIDSRAIESDAWHHLSDALTSGAAAIGISIALVGGKGWEQADDYAALAACVIITINGTRIAARSLHEMLDGNVPEDLVSSIRARAREVVGVVEIEKCRVRKSGIGLFIELHVCVSGDTTVREGHRIGHAVKDHLRSYNPRILDVVVHLEPME